MRRITPIHISCLLSLITLLSTQSLHAKGQKHPIAAPAAPIPAQILSAKKVFVSNGGAHSVQASWEDQASDRPNRAYNELYASMQSWGRYELVSAPSDADVVFEIRITSSVWTFIDKTYATPEVELTIVDPKTRITLWTCIEPKDKGDKGLNEAMTKLMSDLKQLGEPPATALASPEPSAP